MTDVDVRLAPMAGATNAPFRLAGLLTLRVTLTNPRGETVLEAEHHDLLAYRPAA